MRSKEKIFGKHQSSRQSTTKNLICFRFITLSYMSLFWWGVLFLSEYTTLIVSQFLLQSCHTLHSTFLMIIYSWDIYTIGCGFLEDKKIKPIRFVASRHICGHPHVLASRYESNRQQLWRCRVSSPGPKV